jgi:alkanesulfonate monooxygenase SsuD/methylene tetrahydromethanopterin reductase-like flavin-dependent oxidoreductase (luciferase family)
MHTNEVLARGGSFADLRSAGDLSAARAIIPDDLVLAVAAIGTWAEVKERLLALSEAGATDLLVDPSKVVSRSMAAEIQQNRF